MTQRIEAADAYRELGDRVAVDDPASAEVAYRRALDFEPSLPDVYVRLAATLVRLGRLCEAEGHLRAARRLDARHEDAARLSADLLLARGRLAEALACLGGCAHGGSPLLLTEYGDVLTRIGLLDEAELAYREAIAAGECAETRTNLGLLLLDRGDRDGALQEFERALELDPSASEAAVNRANVLVELGRLAEAQVLFEALARANETRAPALWGLAALADSRGDAGRGRPLAGRGHGAVAVVGAARSYERPRAARGGMSGGRVRRVVLAAIRVAVGLFFVAAGVQKVLDHDAYVVRFDRWGLPAPSTAAYVAAGIEIVAGLILILGLATRFAALVLLVEMLVLAATAGRVDGGAELVTAGVLALLLPDPRRPRRWRVAAARRARPTGRAETDRAPAAVILRLGLAYDGTAFRGWAAQPGRRTVQGVLQEALDRVYPGWSALHVAGRTDAGVHAVAQVASCHGRHRASGRRSGAGADGRAAARRRGDGRRGGAAGIPRPAQRPRARLRLPRAGLGAARPAAGPARLPLAGAARPGGARRVRRGDRRPPRLPRLHARGDPAPGLRADRPPLPAGARPATSCGWRSPPDAFLRHQVRTLVGTMLGLPDPALLADLLAGAPRSDAGATAPPFALFLSGVRYEGDPAGSRTCRIRKS